MTAKELRAKTFADIEALGFRPAKSLPNPDVNAHLRPTAEVAARLMALDALFTGSSESSVLFLKKVDKLRTLK